MSISYFDRLVAQSVAVQASVGSSTHTWHELHYSFPQVTSKALTTLSEELSAALSVANTFPLHLNPCPDLIDALAKQCSRLQGRVGRAQADIKSEGTMTDAEQYALLCKISGSVMLGGARRVLQAVCGDKDARLGAVMFCRAMFETRRLADADSATEDEGFHHVTDKDFSEVTPALHGSASHVDDDVVDAKESGPSVEVQAEAGSDSEVDYAAERAAYYAAMSSDEDSDEGEESKETVEHIGMNDGMCKWHFIAPLASSSSPLELLSGDDSAVTSLLLQYALLAVRDHWQPHIFASEGVFQSLGAFSLLRECADTAQQLMRSPAHAAKATELLRAIFLLLSQTFVADVSACRAFLCVEEFQAWFEMFLLSPPPPTTTTFVKNKNKNQNQNMTSPSQLFFVFVQDVITACDRGSPEYDAVMTLVAGNSGSFAEGRCEAIMTTLVRFLATHHSPQKHRMLPRVVTECTRHLLPQIVASLSAAKAKPVAGELLLLLLAVSSTAAAVLARKQPVLQFLLRAQHITGAWSVNVVASDKAQAQAQQKQKPRRVIIRKKKKNDGDQDTKQAEVTMPVLLEASMQALASMQHTCEVSLGGSQGDAKQQDGAACDAAWVQMKSFASYLALGERFTHVMALDDSLRTRVRSVRDVLMAALRRSEGQESAETVDTQHSDAKASPEEATKEDRVEEERARRAQRKKRVRVSAKEVCILLKAALDSKVGASKSD